MLTAKARPAVGHPEHWTASCGRIHLEARWLAAFASDEECKLYKFFCYYLVACLLSDACWRCDAASVGNCGFVSRRGDGAALSRNTAAALSGDATELVVGAVGVQDKEDFYRRWNSTFET